MGEGMEVEDTMQTKSFSHPGLCTVLVDLLKALEELKVMGVGGITGRFGSIEEQWVKGVKPLVVGKGSGSESIETGRGRLRVPQQAWEEKGNWSSKKTTCLFTKMFLVAKLNSL